MRLKAGFYGRNAFLRLGEFPNAPHADFDHVMVGYAVENTLSENGTVARGVCDVRDGVLRSVIERTRVKPCDGGAVYLEEGNPDTFLPAVTVVSMNSGGFSLPSYQNSRAASSAFCVTICRTTPSSASISCPSYPISSFGKAALPSRF